MAIRKKLTLKLVVAWLFAAVLFTVAHPTRTSYLAGLAPVLCGAALRIWACGHLEKNKKLTTSGPYAFVQNPLYLGTFLILLGFGIMGRNVWVLAAGALIFFVYYMPYKKGREGDRLKALFGEAFVAYNNAVPVLFPMKLAPYPNRSRERFVPGLVLNNSEHGTSIAVVVGLVVMALRVLYPKLPPLP